MIAERRGTAQRQVTEYRYDHGNTLRSVTTPDGKTTGFDYDALGRRTRKTADQGGAEATTQYWWNGDQLLAERRRSGGGEGEQVTYLHAPGSFVPVAQLRTPGHAAQAADGASLPVGESETSHYLVDQIGTPQALVNAHGETVWEASYTLHGAVRALHAAAVDNPIRFQGQYADEETGLHYNRFRYYHPGTGRFVNQDPVGLLGGDNLYQYVPNTTAWTDPLGLTARKEASGRASTAHKVTREPGAVGRFTAGELGMAISNDPMASKAYRTLQQQGVDVHLYRADDGIAGEAGGGSVRINMEYQRSTREAMSTLIHEAKHIRLEQNTGNLYGNRGTKSGEYSARALEFYYQKGRRPTADERRSIQALIDELGY